MKCPLFIAGDITPQVNTKWAGYDCIKEECAWWEPKIGSCAVLRIWIALQDIHEVLHDIKAKMPKDFEPRK